MGTLSNDPGVLALYGSFYKLLASIGVAINFNLDAKNDSYLTLFLTYWVLISGSLVIMLPLIYKRVTNGEDMDSIVVDDIEMPTGVSIPTERKVDTET